MLDAVDARALAEFYRELLGLAYRPGDEPPPRGEPDPRGADWLVLQDGGRTVLAFQAVAELPPSTWPDAPVPQQLHLDLVVPTVADLDTAHERAQALGARVLLDRSRRRGRARCTSTPTPPATRSASSSARSRRRADRGGWVAAVDCGDLEPGATRRDRQHRSCRR